MLDQLVVALGLDHAIGHHRAVQPGEGGADDQEGGQAADHAHADTDLPLDGGVAGQGEEFGGGVARPGQGEIGHARTSTGRPGVR